MSPDPHDPNYNATRKTCPICWEQFVATGRQAKTRLCCSRQCKRTAAARRGGRAHHSCLQHRQALRDTASGGDPAGACGAAAAHCGPAGLPALRRPGHHRRAAHHPRSGPAADARRGTRRSDPAPPLTPVTLHSSAGPFRRAWLAHLGERHHRCGSALRVAQPGSSALIAGAPRPVTWFGCGRVGVRRPVRLRRRRNGVSPCRSIFGDWLIGIRRRKGRCTS